MAEIEDARKKYGGWGYLGITVRESRIILSGVYNGIYVG